MSIESVLQAFKFKDPEVQIKMCARVGYWAKKFGYKGNTWMKDQILYWLGKQYKRDSKEYQELLDNLFRRHYQNGDAKVILLETGDAELTHERGKSDITDTVLTESEFISRLRKLREELKKGGDKE